MKEVQPSGHHLRIAGLFCFFFLVIAAFWIQKPIRTSRFLEAVGAENLPWVKLGTAMLTLPVVLAYSALAARHRRQHLVYVCCAVFAAASVLFWWLFREQAPDWTHYAYFFYVDIFNSVMVALFWSFANDLSTPEQAKRDYGVVGAGGIIGGAVGSGVTGWSVESLGAANLLLICVAVLIAIAAIAAFLARTARERPAAEEHKSEASLGDAVAGARLVIGSHYLTCIALIVVCYEIVSNVIDYQFNTFVAERFSSDAASAAFLGKFNTASISASAAAQLIGTTWILRRWGPGVGLLILPLVLGVGSGSFIAVPLFTVIAATFFGDAAFSYSLNQASKEVLYTPTDQATKYQAKAFIDMFLMRFGKAISSLLILGWAALFLPHGVQQLSLLSLAAVVAWFLFARAAGREFARQTSDDASRSSSPTAVGYRRELTHA